MWSLPAHHWTADWPNLLLLCLSCPTSSSQWYSDTLTFWYTGYRQYSHHRPSHRVHDTYGWGPRQDPPEGLRPRRGREHGHQSHVGELHQHTKVQCDEEHEEGESSYLHTHTHYHSHKHKHWHCFLSRLLLGFCPSAGTTTNCCCFSLNSWCQSGSTTRGTDTDSNRTPLRFLKRSCKTR